MEFRPCAFPAAAIWLPRSITPDSTSGHLREPGEKKRGLLPKCISAPWMVSMPDHGDLQPKRFLRFFLDGADNLCHFLRQGFVIHVRWNHSVFANAALRNLSGLIRMDWPCPSVPMPISSCVILAIFSLSVICPRIFDRGGGGGRRAPR